MKKKQNVLTIISKDGKFLAPNRKTARKFKVIRQRDLKNKELDPDKEFKYERIEQTPKLNVKGSEFAKYRKELAVQHGSQTGKLKKKHLAREKGLKLRGESNV